MEECVFDCCYVYWGCDSVVRYGAARRGGVFAGPTVVSGVGCPLVVVVGGCVFFGRLSFYRDQAVLEVIWVWEVGQE